MSEAALDKNSVLKRTPLYNLHLSKAAKMVPFAGYDMPVQYEGMGVLTEHQHTRAHAGLFDVSHMGQIVLRGKTGNDPAAALERVVPTDIAGLHAGQQKYSVLLNDKGGIVDDLMIARWDAQTLFLVVNAACKDKDIAYLQAKISDAVEIEVLEDRALLALQGPAAESIASTFFSGILEMRFMDAMRTEYEGAAVFVSRSGYTGEDGFEISVPAALAEKMATEILQEGNVRLIGLGARDSLRLEAGLCLYGHDLDDHSTPVDANLRWVISQNRRRDASFAGAERIMAQLMGGTDILRVGILPDGPAPMREKTELFDMSERKVGVITSGGFGPTVGGPVAMGYVNTNFSKPDTELRALLRGEMRPCKVVKLPFVPHRYKKP